MCGIVAVCGVENVKPLLLAGLEALEYRGYDSAGLALVVNGKIEILRSVGKVANLRALALAAPIVGTVGIAHTRWATHGKPTVKNAHPHATKDVAVVHNGVIENFAELKKELMAKGYLFASSTDSEVIAVLLQSLLDKGFTSAEAFKTMLLQLCGTYAICVIFASEPDRIYGAKLGSPLAIGIGNGWHFMGSDSMAMPSGCREVVYLEERDSAVITKDSFEISNDGKSVSRRMCKIEKEVSDGRGDFAYFMQKEIFEQPEIMEKNIIAPIPNINFEEIEKIHIVACGTSYHAGLVAKYWIESLSDICVEVETASEFRYRRPILKSGEIALFISQSGETADTLAALRYAKEKGQRTIAMVNAKNSSMTREASVVLDINAGAEIGVASTKVFTAQLTILARISLDIARVRATLSANDIALKEKSLADIPMLAKKVLELDAQIKDIAKIWLLGRHDVIFIGRGYIYPIALEGALKLKEISYMHAEGYSAGEIKHGPIALVSPGVPCVVLSPYDSELFQKTISNMYEVKARGGNIILVSDAAHCSKLANEVEATIPMPEIGGFVEPLIYSLPVQMLAYHTTTMLGFDPDRPRNLAKSVTVE